MISYEEFDGRLKTIEASLKQGDYESKIEGSVILGALRLRMQRGETTTGSEIPWPKEYGGPFAVAQSLRGDPMKPGETRTLSMLDPVLGQVVQVTLRAKDFMKTPLMDGLQHNLLEIVSEVKLGDKGISSILWVNDVGETQKTYTSELDIRSFRVERTFAESIRDAAICENMTVRSIPLNSTIKDYDSAESLVFRMRHRDNDPFRILPGRTNQSLKWLIAFTVNVTVYPMKETTSMPEGVSPELQSPPECSNPSPVIQSDDEMVMKLATTNFEDKSLGKTVLERLRRGVYNWITTKTAYATQLSSAAEVARSQSGDSGEHAVLLAAVVRARNVPSRVAIGLKYNGSDTDPAMVLHFWTEVYLKDHWVSVDASIEEPRTNATYVKLVDTPMADDNPYAPLLAALKAIEEFDLSVAN